MEKLVEPVVFHFLEDGGTMKVSTYMQIVHTCRYRICLLIIIGEGALASEPQNPATPLSQGNEEVGVGLH